MLRAWPYFLRQAVWNIIRNRGVHAVGMGTMVASLLIFGAFLLLFVNLNAWVGGWERGLSMSVYLEDGISEAQREKVAAFIREISGAEIKRYISKKRALEELRGALGPQATLLEGLSKNPLPASFEVVFGDTGEGRREPQKIKEALEGLKGVDDVQYSEEWLKRFEALMRMIRLVGFIIGGLLCIGVLFIVTNTIKLTIYARKEEIEILKLVGATDWFVKTPFLLEGMLQGAASGVLSVVGLFLGYLLLSAKQAPFLGLPMVHFIFIPHSHALFMFLMSLLLGLVGSFIAVGRFFEI